MRILLGVSAGIAAYKSPDLVRRLIKAGHEVRVVLSPAARNLVSEQALAVVSGKPVHWDLWAERESMEHISLARWTECFLIAPATADCIAKIALGLADDLLSTTVLATEDSIPLILAPAMNSVMWNKAIVQEHLKTLKKRGIRTIGPVEGLLACNEVGVGAMADLDAIVAAL